MPINPRKTANDFKFFCKIWSRWNQTSNSLTGSTLWPLFAQLSEIAKKFHHINWYQFQRKNFKKTSILLGTNLNEGHYFIIYYLTEIFKKEVRFIYKYGPSTASSSPHVYFRSIQADFTRN